MNDDTKLSAIQRKAGGGRARSEGVGMTPAKAFRIALTKAAQDELNLALRVLSVQEERRDQVQLLDGLDGDQLLVLLEGAQGETGLAVIDTQVLAAVIEMQTLGHVKASEASVRHPTRTDSAMCEAVFNCALHQFGRHLAGGPSAFWATGFRFGDPVEGIRLLGLKLEDTEYRVFHISVDLAEGMKQGAVMVALPAMGYQSRQAKDVRPNSWAKKLETIVCASTADILAVLHREEFPLAEVTGFRVGDTIPIPHSAISEVSLQGMDGRVVGRARLGQQHGFRALRVSCEARLPLLSPAQSTGERHALPDANSEQKLGLDNAQHAIETATKNADIILPNTENDVSSAVTDSVSADQSREQFAVSAPLGMEPS